jgi:DME family drug/metabolite transporter
VQQLAFINGLDRTGSAEGALLLSTAPIWAAVIGAALGQDRVLGRNWLGVGLGFIGVALILRGGEAPGGREASHLPGDLLVLTAGILYGAFAVLSRPLMRKHGALQVVTLSMCVCALLFIPVGGAEVLSADWRHLDWRGWARLAYLTLPAGAIGFVVWYRAVDRQGPSKALAYQYLVPVAALAAGVAFRHERIEWSQWLGAAITLVGIALARWRPQAEVAGERYVAAGR